MNKSAFTLTLGLFLSLCLTTRADELVKLPTGPASWMIDVSEVAPPVPDKKNRTAENSASTNKPSEPLSGPIGQIEVTQDNEKAHYVTKYVHGTTEDSWCFPKLKIAMLQDPGGTVFFAGPEGINFGPGAFDWLKPSFLKEKKPVPYLGKQCWHYSGYEEVFNPYPPPKGSIIRVKHQAWIDSKTLLPVALLNHDTELGVYTFSDQPPQGALTLPPKYTRILAYRKRAMGL